MDIRVTDAEREQTAETLRRAGQVGAIDVEELDQRLTAAFTAKTRGQLEVLVRDLPVLDSRPVIAERSRWWLWAVFALPVGAWIHALVITRLPRYAVFAVLYSTPLAMLAAFDNGTEIDEGTSWLDGIYAVSWLIGLVHVLMTRDEVDRHHQRP